MEITDINSFLEYYERVRERTLKVIAVVPHDKLDWAYMPGKYTIADLIRHVAAMERNMFAENVAGRQSCYAGCGKELADGYDAVLDYFQRLHTESIEIFRSLDDEDLFTKCPNPAGQITTWKWLRAMVEHEIHHRGELYIYLNLLGVTTPPMFGLSAEQVQERSLKIPA